MNSLMSVRPEAVPRRSCCSVSRRESQHNREQGRRSSQARLQEAPAHRITARAPNCTESWGLKRLPNLRESGIQQEARAGGGKEREAEREREREMPKEHKGETAPLLCGATRPGIVLPSAGGRASLCGQAKNHIVRQAAQRTAPGPNFRTNYWGACSERTKRHLVALRGSCHWPRRS